jgi:YD repeat-containing protein
LWITRILKIDALTRPRYEYSYNAEGQQTLIRDPLLRETRLTYNERGQQLSRTLPLGIDNGDFTERMEYDQKGRQTLHVSFEGVVTQFVYTETNGRLAEQRFFDNATEYSNGLGIPDETWSYTYDAFGRQLTVDRRALGVSPGSLTTYEYNNRQQLERITSPEGTISYTFDNLGRKTATIVGTVNNPQRITSYTYDSLGRLATVVEDLTTTATGDELHTGYHYNLIGNLSRTDLPNGVYAVNVYDNMNRLDVLTHYRSDNTPLSQFDYTTRADGKRTSAQETFWTTNAT